MIIDLILDRKDNEQLLEQGHTHVYMLGDKTKPTYHGEQTIIEDGYIYTQVPLAYNAKNFYQHVMDYGEVGFGITAAMDGGTEEDVKRELCKYIIDNEYNPDLCNYINERTWL